MTEDVGYELVELVQGYPGRSRWHGGLGWSSVSLLRGPDRLVLVDSGSFGMRPMLGQLLAQHRVDPGEVTDVLLSHAHYDHAANYPLFPAATVHIGAAELEWAVKQGPTFTPLPELYARDLAESPRTAPVEPGADGWARVLPGIDALAAPGHTPGSLVYRVAGADSTVLFTGDAAKNRAELLSGDVDMTLDRETSRATVARIRSAWRRDADILLIPGHDLPMRWPADAPAPHHLGTRRAAIQAWFGDDLTTTHTIDLTTPTPPWRES
jgi:N-acyl homoserine lactone hydrolase